MKNQSTTTSVKIHLESTEIRRFPIENNSFTDYSAKLSKVCKISEGTVMEYLDCEGDWVHLSTEEDFQQAMMFKKGNVLVLRKEQECGDDIEKNEKNCERERKRERKSKGKCIVYSSSSDDDERKEKRRRGGKMRGMRGFGRMRRFEKKMKDFPKFKPHTRREERKCKSPFRRIERRISRIKDKMEMIKHSSMPEEIKVKLIYKLKEKLYLLKEKRKLRKFEKMNFPEEKKCMRMRRNMMKKCMKRRCRFPEECFFERRFRSEMY